MISPESPLWLCFCSLLFFLQVGGNQSTWTKPWWTCWWDLILGRGTVGAGSPRCTRALGKCFFWISFNGSLHCLLKQITCFLKSKETIVSFWGGKSKKKIKMFNYLFYLFWYVCPIMKEWGLLGNYITIQRQVWISLCESAPAAQNLNVSGQYLKAHEWIKLQSLRLQSLRVLHKSGSGWVAERKPSRPHRSSNLPPLRPAGCFF